MYAATGPEESHGMNTRRWRSRVLCKLAVLASKAAITQQNKAANVQTRLKASKEQVGESDRMLVSSSWHPWTTNLDFASQGYSLSTCSLVLPVFLAMRKAISLGLLFFVCVGPASANDLGIARKGLTSSSDSSCTACNFCHDNHSSCIDA